MGDNVNDTIKLLEQLFLGVDSGAVDHIVAAASAEVGAKSANLSEPLSQYRSLGSYSETPLHHMKSVAATSIHVSRTTISLFGVILNVLIIAVFRAQRERWKAKHYFLVAHLTLANLLVSTVSLIESVGQLFEWYLDSSLLQNKFDCGILLFRWDAAVYMQLMIAVDRLYNIEFPSAYNQMTHKYVYILVGFAWLLYGLEYVWVFMEALREKGLLNVCLLAPSTGAANQYTSFTNPRDIILASLTLAFYGTLAAANQWKIRQAQYRGEEYAHEAKKRLKPKVYRMCVIDTAFFLITSLIAGAAQEALLREGTPAATELAPTVVEFVISLNGVNNFVTYYLIHKKFRQCFKATFCTCATVPKCICIGHCKYKSRVQPHIIDDGSTVITAVRNSRSPTDSAYDRSTVDNIEIRF